MAQISGLKKPSTLNSFNTRIVITARVHPLKIVKLRLSQLSLISIRKVKINLNFSKGNERERVKIGLIFGFLLGWTPGPVFSHKLRYAYIVDVGLVEMAISTNPKPTIYILTCTRIRALAPITTLPVCGGRPSPAGYLGPGGNSPGG